MNLPAPLQQRLERGQQLLQQDRTVGSSDWQQLLQQLRQDFASEGYPELADFVLSRTDGGLLPQQQAVGVRIQPPGMAVLVATYYRSSQGGWERGPAVPYQSGLWAVARNPYTDVKDWKRVPDLERALALAAEIYQAS